MLLPFIFASTSLLTAFPGGPGAESFTTQTGEGHTITVEVALARAEGEVPVPIRFSGSDIDVDVTICDGAACTGGRQITVGAGAVVDDVVIVDAGRPNLRFTNAESRPFLETCCDRGGTTGRTVAIVGPAPASEAVSTYVNGSAVVFALGVGRLLDVHPEQLGNVGAVVLLDDDLDHDAAFFANLQRFIRLGGLVSVDEAQAARLVVGPATSLTDLQAHDLTAFPGTSTGTFDIVLADGRRTRSVDADDIPGIHGRIHIVDSGLVVVRERGTAPLDAVADLVQARRRFINGRGHDWRSTGELTNGLLVGLQPRPNTGAMVLWFMLTSVVAAVVARVVVARRAGLDGPVLASAAVVFVMLVSGVAGVGASQLSSSWRSVRLRVDGPGATIHTSTLASARAPDGIVDLASFVTALDDKRRSFVVDGNNERRARYGAAVAEVTIDTNIVEGTGHLACGGEAYVNKFPHAVDVHTSNGLVIGNVAPGARVTDYDTTMSERRDDFVQPHVARTIDLVQQRCHCGVAVYVDATGTTTVVEGTPQ